MAPIAQKTAPMSRCSSASATYEPMPGSFQVLSPSVIASDATTKNQPPDIDSIMFHTRPGMANGTSSRQNRCHGGQAEPARRLVEVGRASVVSDW